MRIVQLIIAFILSILKNNRAAVVGAGVASAANAEQLPKSVSAPVGFKPVEHPMPTFSPFDGPLDHRPKNLAGIIEMFGDPTRHRLYLKVADPKWEKANIVEEHGDQAFLPVLAPSYFPIHKLIEPYAREAFRRAELACPGYVHRSGTWGYNFRHMRHDPKMPLSYHSYGIAIDVNPDDNQAHQYAGKSDVPFSLAWKTRWPKGVPQGVVDAFESCGFSWGGRWNGYCDPMHFEWVGARDVQV